VANRLLFGDLTGGCFVMTQDGDPNAELNVHPAPATE